MFGTSQSGKGKLIVVKANEIYPSSFVSKSKRPCFRETKLSKHITVSESAYSKKKTFRLIKKRGEINVQVVKITLLNCYINDITKTIVDFYASVFWNVRRVLTYTFFLFFRRHQQRRTSHESINANREYEDIGSVISNTDNQQNIIEITSHDNEVINDSSHEYYNEASYNEYVDLNTNRELHTYWTYDGEYQYL